MDQRTVASKAGEIRQDIYREREALGENLSELQAKVRRTADWREQFRRHTVTMLTAAFGGGILFAMVFTCGRSR
ncbi:MAG TPA: hypothetical protein VFZ27_10620 [Terriglobia bacterium]|nr:hypothetical protein [Terriglobia bacterium]